MTNITLYPHTEREERLLSTALETVSHTQTYAPDHVDYSGTHPQRGEWRVRVYYAEAE